MDPFSKHERETDETFEYFCKVVRVFRDGLFPLLVDLQLVESEMKRERGQSPVRGQGGG